MSDFKEDLSKRVEKFISKYLNCISKEHPLFLGVSGGPDSIFLMHILDQIIGRECLHILHLNHKLRGKASDADEHFVIEAAQERNLPITVKHADVMALAKEKKMGLEEAGRYARHKIFMEIASSCPDCIIALGHHRDDMVETVLMRLIRGSGGRGIAQAVSPVTDFCQDARRYRIVRPLGSLKKSDILDYLKDHRIGYRHDATNTDTRYFRNLIRHDLLDRLRSKYHADVEDHIYHFASVLREDYAFLDLLIEEHSQELLVPHEQGISILLDRIDVRWMRHLFSWLTKILVKEFGPLKGWTRWHFREIEKIITSPKPSVTQKFPGSIYIVKDYRKLTFTKKMPMINIRPFQAVYPWPVSKINSTDPPLQIHIDILPLNDAVRKDIQSTSVKTAYFDAGKFQDPICVRSRKNGDRFWPLGQPKEGKLKGFFINQKIPRVERDRWPLLLSHDKIFWVMGLRVSEEAKVSKDTKNVVRMSLVETDAN